MDTPTPPTGSDDGPEPPTTAPTRQRLSFGMIAAATVIALVVALSFSFIALTLLDRSNETSSVSVEDALANIDAGPAVPAGTPVAAVGQPAPDVRLDYLDGGTQQVSELRGTPLLLNFWSSTCAPCVSEMPEFEALANRAAGRVRVVGVDVTDTDAGAADLLRRTGVTYRNAADPNGELLATFGGTSLPRTVLIAADGTVLATRAGALDAAGINALLSENGIDVP